MKIAYIVSRYPFISHVFILREVEALRRAGVEIDTFTVRRPGDEQLLTDAERRADATTHALVPPAPGDLIAACLRALITRPRLWASTLGLALSLRGLGARAVLWQVFYFVEATLMWNECRRRGIRHIHAHHANVASDVALLAAHLGGTGWSWSFTMHGSTEFFDVREHRLPQKVELARFVSCVSAHGRSQLMFFVGPEHWDKLHVVHCGIDPALFQRSGERGAGGPLEILTVGRVVPVKGQPLLVDALGALVRSGVDARLTIVGDGPGIGDLRERARRLGVEDRLELAGAVGQDGIRAFYERADVFALPSFAEGLPVVLVEALAMEVPVVASRITGIPELVEEGVSGLLVLPGDGDELIEAFANMASRSADERAAMGRAGRARVVVEFDVDASARGLKELFMAYLGELAPNP
jgi:glycosyltransferase involved in cell wall biosynthesis